MDTDNDPTTKERTDRTKPTYTIERTDSFGIEHLAETVCIVDDDTRIWAGTATLKKVRGYITIECAAVLAEDGEDDADIYEAIEEAINEGETEGVTEGYFWNVQK